MPERQLPQGLADSEHSAKGASYSAKHSARAQRSRLPDNTIYHCPPHARVAHFSFVGELRRGHACRELEELGVKEEAKGNRGGRMDPSISLFSP